MTIAYCGNFTQAHCTEVHLAATLEKLGHRVIQLQEDALPNEWTQTPCDFMLWTRTWPDKVTLNDLAQFPLTVSYHLDLYVGLGRHQLHEGRSLQEVLQNDPFWRTDYVFTPDGDPESDRVFKECGVNHVYIKPGVFEGDCYIAKNPKTKDVIFVGSKTYHPEYPYRPQLISWLRDNYGERFEHWGHDGLGTVRNDPLNQLYGSTKIVVGDSLVLPNHINYWSDRAYETLGRGGFLVHPYIKGMEEEFEGGKHLIFYKHGDFNELRAIIDYYLAHPKQREGIRKQGHEFVKNHATYTDRLKQMLEVLTREKKIDPELGNV